MGPKMTRIGDILMRKTKFARLTMLACNENFFIFEHIAALVMMLASRTFPG